MSLDALSERPPAVAAPTPTDKPVTLYLAYVLAWMDIRGRYRRSRLGQFWLTISHAFFVFGIGMLYATFFNAPIERYLPYLAGGFVVWQWLSSLVLEGCQTFIGASRFILQQALPYRVHVLRVVLRNAFIFAHNIVVFFVVLIIFQPPEFGWSALLAIPGIALVLLNGTWVALLLGTISARFRDVPQIISSIMQIMFFVTPIIWSPDTVGARGALVAALNPFAYFLDIVRGPFLGKPPALESWLVVLAITAIGWGVALTLYRRYRHRIAYWI